MTISHASSRSIDQLAEEYARSRTNRLQPVSITDALRTFRNMMPKCTWSDDRLTNLLASKLVQYGHGIVFDARFECPAPQDHLSDRLAEIDVVTLLPTLRARAFAIVQQRKMADDLVEASLKLAINRIASTLDPIDFETWLESLVDEAAMRGAAGNDTLSR